MLVRFFKLKFPILSTILMKKGKSQLLTAEFILVKILETEPH
jgi:hypothetical protein